MQQQHSPSVYKTAISTCLQPNNDLCHLADASLIIGQGSWWEVACLSLGSGIWLLKDSAVFCLASAAHVTEYAWFRQGRKSSLSPCRQTPPYCVLLFPDRLYVNICFSTKQWYPLTTFFLLRHIPQELCCSFHIGEMPNRKNYSQ